MPWFVVDAELQTEDGKLAIPWLSGAGHEESMQHALERTLTHMNELYQEFSVSWLTITSFTDEESAQRYIAEKEGA
jgi:hypothetical protein